jgi:hypothetical protein
MSNVIDLNTDPVFVAVRKWKAATAALNCYPRHDDDPENLELEEAYLAADDYLWRVVPTTVTGFKVKCAASYAAPIRRSCVSLSAHQATLGCAG